MTAPTLVVVGRTNKGKSSVVATLGELPPGSRPVVDARPGTTTTAASFPVSVDDEVLFTLVDTPGLEEAPRARDWMQRHAASAAERPAALRAFVQTFAGTEAFREEVRALTPILDGGGILYVVDGTQPYRARHEAEMEILQWTGRPRMALINRIRHADSDDAERIEQHVADWKAALHQYFSTVQEFDAHRATFAERLEMLRTLAALDPGWRDALRRAVDAMVAQRAQRDAVAAGIITDLLVEAVTYTGEVTLPAGEPAERHRERLYEAFHAHLVKQEDRARRRIEKLYGHEAFRFEDGVERAAFDADLFAESSWSTFGLSPLQLVGLSTVVGAVAGGTLDAMVGGASWGAGAGLGGVVTGGFAALQVGRRFAEVSMEANPLAVWRMSQGERTLRIGPHPSPNFGWVLLDRALAHLHVVRTWAHARPTSEASLEGAVRVADLEGTDKRAIHGLFAKLRRAPRSPSVQVRAEL